MATEKFAIVYMVNEAQARAACARIAESFRASVIRTADEAAERHTAGMPEAARRCTLWQRRIDARRAELKAGRP